VIEDLAAAVDRLFEHDIESMTDAEIRAEFIAVRQQLDRGENRASTLLAGLHGRGVPLENGASSTPAWVQWQTGQRVGEARASLDAGLACESLPLTAKAWEQGEISASAARAICEGRPDGHEVAYGEAEEILVGYAADRNWRDLRAVIAQCKRCADALDHREPADRNGLHHSKTADRWVLSGDLDDLGGGTVAEALRAAIGEISEDDLRSPAKRRADALVEICRYFLDHADLPMEGGEAPHVTIGIPWETACNRIADATIANRFGPSLSRTQLSELLCDCNLSRVIFGPESQPLDVGRTQRTAPRWIRRAIKYRDQGCRFPGCGRTARLKAHHVQPWEDGGDTNVENLVCLCQFHHGVVHRNGWANTFDGTTYTVTNPNGRIVGSTTTRAP
jgi:hypothetical protein